MAKLPKPGGTLALAAALVLAGGCSSTPRGPAPSPDAQRLSHGDRAARSSGESLARSALALLGAPYRFGGATPQGFDCSGLVFYLHERVGVSVPRTAAAQRQASAAVAIDALASGDLVFFRMSGAKVDHVGVYVGEGRFVHAPGRARPVSLERLDDPVYRVRLVSAGRFWKR